MPKFNCPSCGNPRNLTRKPPEGITCRECSIKNKVDNRRERKCIDCGDIKKEKYRSAKKKTLRCTKCSGIERAKRRFGKKKIYYYFCASCPQVKVERAKRIRSRCLSCSKNRRRERIYFDFNSMNFLKKSLVKIHTRICPECPIGSNSKVVKSSQCSGIKLCRKHSAKKNRSASKGIRFNNPIIKKQLSFKKSKKIISPEAIERRREENKKHREKEAEEKKKKIPQKKTDEEMIVYFLKNNDPSVKFTDDYTNHDLEIKQMMKFRI